MENLEIYIQLHLDLAASSATQWILENTENKIEYEPIPQRF